MFDKKKKKKKKNRQKDEQKDANFYYKRIDPIVEDTLTYEQIVEIKKVIKLAIPDRSKEVKNFSFRIWLRKFYKINISIDSIDTSTKEHMNDSFGGIWGIIWIVMMTTLLLFVALGILTLVFMILYYLKIMSGIDFLEGHIIQPHFFDASLFDQKE